MTFRIECFVEDKALASALRSLAELKVSGLDVQPVVNRVPNGDAAHGTRFEAATSILNSMPQNFSVLEIKTRLKSLGINDPNYYLQRWKAEKLIRLGKVRGTWRKV